MERYSLFLGRKNQYCEYDCITKCNLQSQCDPYQITNGIFHRIRTKSFTIHVETQRPQMTKAVLRMEWSWRNQPSYFSFFMEPPYCSLQWLYRFIFPSTVQEDSLFSTASPAFGVCFFDDSHSAWWEVIPHCGFDLPQEWRH